MSSSTVPHKRARASGRARMRSTSALMPAVQQLEKIMSTDVPEAPLLYGADWNVYSSAKYIGWPNQSHPYMNPTPSDPQLPYILMQLHAAS